VAKGFLRKWQANIREAGNGIEALELMRHHTFDIILMDLDMPEMDGYTATQRIRQQGIDIPILAFTAALIEDLEIKLKQTGFDGYILKPFKPTDLYKKIEACLQAHVLFV
jgi:CheY-like chemotaxis protein